jgi:hypothetical protein
MNFPLYLYTQTLKHAIDLTVFSGKVSISNKANLLIMKKILILVLLISVPSLGNAQIYDTLKLPNKYPNYTRQGDLSINSSFSHVRKNLIQNDPYSSIGGELNMIFYVSNRVGIETGFASNHYNYLLSNPQGPKIYDEKNLALINCRLRYQFYQIPNSTTFFVETGYSYGWFINTPSNKLHRWEIGSFGSSSSFTRKYIPNLDFIFSFGFYKDNLNSKVSTLSKFGLQYYLGNL